MDSGPEVKSRRSIQSRTTSPYPPVLAPLASFSRFSLSLEPTRSSSTGSAFLDAQAAPRIQTETPSLTRTSTVASSRSRSSTSSLGGLARRKTNLIQVDRRGNVGCILDQPDPPRLVIFLPASEAQQRQRSKAAPAGAGGSSSLLVIDSKFHENTPTQTNPPVNPPPKP